jgi:murein DD-endopeptidase MepM/ murein hydrolase activator NlpD
MKFTEIIRLVATKFFAKLITLKAAIIVLIFISIVVILEVISNIPIIGDKITDNVKDQIETMATMQVLDADKLPYYLELENGSYLKEISAVKTIEKATYSLTDISEEKNYDFLENPSSESETVELDMTARTRKYRLWWQSLAAFDIISLGGNESSTKVVDKVSETLSPIYNYNFIKDAYNNADNFDLNDYSFTKNIVTTKYYVDGTLTNTKTSQTNIKETIPYPCLETVSTMFFDYTFTYVLREVSDKESSNTTTTTGSTYIMADNGSYIYEFYSYRLANPTEVGQRYKKADTKTVITTDSEYKYFSYLTNESVIKNERYISYFDDNTKENGFEYKEEEALEIVLLGEHISDAYEFVNQGLSYFDRSPNYLYIQSEAYSGSVAGNYNLSDPDTGYLLPIKFSDKEDVVYTVRISSPYGPRDYGDGFHDGIDFAIPVGTPIVAAQSGTITEHGYNSVRGNYIEIKHENGTYTRYWHNSSLLIPEDLYVEQGEVISLSGNSGESTGPHLHFEYRDSNHNLLDPMLILPLVKKVN